MAKESPIKRPVVRLPEGGQLGLFGSKELQGSERHAERSGKVIFNQGSVEDLFIGSVRVEEHLRVTGEREAFVVREVLLYRGLNCWIPAFIRLCESPVNSTSG